MQSNVKAYEDKFDVVASHTPLVLAHNLIAIPRLTTRGSMSAYALSKRVLLNGVALWHDRSTATSSSNLSFTNGIRAVNKTCSIENDECRSNAGKIHDFKSRTACCCE
eukprot:TRINITY_DN35399_c0_g1_i1.p1 TRINITY_DN35399_c0_g1~~TRINITY_DN35399_c0_g1_i1.p1  ORF type:complete len:108 (-),score=1.74 TRINITY_DN35399_c0_g1_i1:2-325(-)